jgi:hypothetical protein
MAPAIGSTQPGKGLKHPAVVAIGGLIAYEIV